MVEELLAEVKAARRARAADKKHTGRVKELLVEVRERRPDLDVVKIEAMIGRFYDRSTISRLTAEAVGKSRKGVPKPPDADVAPDGS